MKAIVSVRDAVKNYKLGEVEVPALRGVTLEVAAGDFISIAGPSGSGKTTLLNLIGCVDTPTSGIVEVAGKDTRKLSERELTDLRLNTIGFIFQSFNLVAVLTVFQNIELPLLLQQTLIGHRARGARHGPAGAGGPARVRATTGRASFRAGSGSASPSRARWSRDRSWCWPTSRPRTWTPSPGRTSWT